VSQFWVLAVFPLEKKKMKRTWITAGILLLLLMPVMYAQTNTMDSKSEKAVQITSGPTISNINPTSATIHWTTDREGANHVRYRDAGTSNWQSAYHAGGGKDHSLQLSGLQPGKTYEWQILTRDGDVRTSGQFTTPTSGTAPDVNSAATQPATAPSSPASPGATTGAKVPLYRFVGGNDIHMFSTSTSGPSGFNQEGTVGFVLQSQAPGTVPLYALSNGKDAMLSTSASEGGMQGTQVGYIASSPQAGAVPLYRMYDSTGKHFATASEQEHAQALQKGMKDDAIIGYIWPSQ
jgi:Fibronectin type III domain/Repeat of unknown function (DUF5648)